MDAALTSLQQSGDREFLRLTHTALKIIQNVLSEPHEEKYRRLRIASKVPVAVYISTHTRLENVRLTAPLVEIVGETVLMSL